MACMGHAELLLLLLLLLLAPVGMFCSVCIQAATLQANMSLIFLIVGMSQQADRSLGVLHFIAG